MLLQRADGLLGNFGRKVPHMSGTRFTDEFKRGAVTQIEDRGYPVRKVSERLGVSTKSIYTWQRLFPRPAKVVKAIAVQADEVRQLKWDLARVTQDQDILKMPTAYFARESPSRACSPRLLSNSNRN